MSTSPTGPASPTSRVMFPRPAPVRTQPCAKCGTPVRLDRLVAGRYGEDCAGQLGLITATPRLRVSPQTGPDLFDNFEEEDHCDGWDR